MSLSDAIKLEIPKDVLYHLKIELGMTREDIAIKLKKSDTTIKRLLSFYGIKTDRTTVKPKLPKIDVSNDILSYHPNTITKSPELLKILQEKTKILDNLSGVTTAHRRYYLEKGYTKIPKCAGCDNLTKLDIEYTKKVFAQYCSTSCSGKTNKHSEETKQMMADIDAIRYLREVEMVSLEQIASDIGIGWYTLVEICKENNISVDRFFWNEKPNAKQISDSMVLSRGVNKYGEEIYSKLSNKDFLESEWDSGKTFKEIGAGLGVDSSIVSNMFTKLGIEYNPARWLSNGASIVEKELLDHITSIYSGKIVHSHREEYTGMELDIYLPDLNLGFEFNGVFFHSTKRKATDYHKIKSQYWKSRGVSVIFIWEDCWVNRKDIVKDYVESVINCCAVSLKEIKHISKSIVHHKSSDIFIQRHIADSSMFVGTECLKTLVGYSKSFSDIDIKLIRLESKYDIARSIECLGKMYPEISRYTIILDMDLQSVFVDELIRIGFDIETEFDADYMVYDRKTKTRIHKTKVQDISEDNLICYDSGKIKFIKIILK